MAVKFLACHRHAWADIDVAAAGDSRFRNYIEVIRDLKRNSPNSNATSNEAKDNKTVRDSPALFVSSNVDADCRQVPEKGGCKRKRGDTVCAPSKRTRQGDTTTTS